MCPKSKKIIYTFMEVIFKFLLPMDREISNLLKYQNQTHVLIAMYGSLPAARFGGVPNGTRRVTSQESVAS